jgi:hypothetical protein
MNAVIAGTKRRFLVTVAGLVVVLAVAGTTVFLFSKREVEQTTSVGPNLDAAVERLLRRYNIEARSVRLRKVMSDDKKFTRLERRISVSPAFNALNFNHDLSRAVAEFGATVVAAEKSENGSVAMHIKKDGVIIQSLVFSAKKQSK